MSDKVRGQASIDATFKAASALNGWWTRTDVGACHDGTVHCSVVVQKHGDSVCAKLGREELADWIQMLVCTLKELKRLEKRARRQRR